MAFRQRVARQGGVAATKKVRMVLMRKTESFIVERKNFRDGLWGGGGGCVCVCVC